jgi:hypothetical protein
MLELRKVADKPADAPLLDLDENGVPKKGPWPLKHVELVGEAPANHNFADSFVAKALQDGYLSFEGMTLTQSEGYERNPVVTGKEIVLKLKGATLRYKIIEPPGRYEEDDGPRVSHEYRCRLIRG